MKRITFLIANVLLAFVMLFTSCDEGVEETTAAPEITLSPETEADIEVYQQLMEYMEEIIEEGGGTTHVTYPERTTTLTSFYSSAPQIAAPEFIDEPDPEAEEE